MVQELKIHKPFLKWVGGKTQIIKEIISIMPSEMNNYHEPFVGGGSVLFAVLSLQQQHKINIKNKIYAYDINYSLINVYKQIQKNNNELFKTIKLYLDEYENINENENINRNPQTINEAKTSRESYYYWLRNKFNNINKDTIESAALFILINKLCFRGMYREGPNGFNVPYGHYKKTPAIITQKQLADISKLIENVEFIHSDFIDSFKNIKNDDFMYLDPPYAPETKTSFVNYNISGFNLNMHELLFTEIKNFKDVKFIMSNSNVKLVTDNFKDYNCKEIIARRAINSINPGSTTKEVIIYN